MPSLALVASGFSRKISAVTLTLAISIACAGNRPPVAGAPQAVSEKASRAALQDLRQQLATLFNAPVMAHGTWGVEVRSLDRGDVLFAHNAGRLMMPASNMKILTLAVAAERLGWDYHFTTTLETSGIVEAGVLHGDLIVRSNGDPTMSTRGKRGAQVLDEWATALKDMGITGIDGRIVGDDQAFDDDVIGPGWSWDYLEAGYAAPVGALQYNENTADLTTVAGAAVGDPIIVQLAPGSGYSVMNRAITGDGAESGRRGAVNVSRRIDRPELEISGMLPLGAPSVSRLVAVINPTLFFAQSLKEGLIARGIPVSGEAVDGDDVAAQPEMALERRVLVTTTSPPLRDIATVLMKVSQNQYAETLLKAAGAANGGIGTTSAGRRAAIETFTSWGIPTDGYVMSDGSGLSRYNYIAPSTITTILAKMYGEPKHREAFLSTLPIAGKDGTISSRMRKTRAEGNAVAKTGSIANVRSLSGYVRTRNGELLAFSIIANDFVIPSATVNYIADVAVEALANLIR
jgi:D-alanyl-D-alanine carboxypeptidase/D-alanyl-D-alanine-endopeptidase (penicillin-binding protein 4)